MALGMRPPSGPRRGARGIEPGRLPRLLLLLLAGLVLGISCDEAGLVPPFCPRYQVGALEGYVRVAGAGVEVTVGARMITYPGAVLFETRSDPTGWYRLELPVDTYRIEVDPGGGGYTSSSPRDTVRVAAGTRRLDLLRGRTTVRVATPATLEGRTFSCFLDPVDGYVSRPYASAPARNGSLEFLFPIVAAGTYRIGLGVTSNFWLPGTEDRASAELISVPVDRPIVHEGALDRYASISGSIRGSWQETHLSGPGVTAYGLDSRRVGSASTEAGGSFTLDLFIAQPVRLRVGFNGIEQWIGGDSLETATVFTPQPGDHLENISIIESGILCRLEGPGYLSDHRAEVLLRDESGRMYGPSGDGANPIALCNLRPGRYSLHVYGYCDYDGEPWASQWYDGADSLAAATPIDLSEGRLVPITVHLAAGGTIAARVLAADGQPVQGVAVAAFDRDGVPLCGEQQWRYFAVGAFSFLGLGNGDYMLAARTDQGPWWYPGTALLDSARVIEIRDHATVTGIEWRLPPALGERQP